MLLGITLSNLSGYQKNLKTQIFFNQVCRVPGHQHSAKEALPRATPAHSATFLLCRVPAGDTRQYFTFAECHLEALGIELTPSAPLTGGARRARVLGTCSGFAECHPASTRQRRHVAECLDLSTACTRQCPGMPCARFLPSVRGLALGKPHLCRVPVVWHSAKTETLGNYRFSGSVTTPSVGPAGQFYPSPPVAIVAKQCLYTNGHPFTDDLIHKTVSIRD